MAADDTTGKLVDVGASLIDNVAKTDTGGVVSLLLLFMVILCIVIVYLSKKIAESDEAREEANKLALEAHNRIVEMQADMLTNYHTDRNEFVKSMGEINRTLDSLVQKVK